MESFTLLFLLGVKNKNKMFSRQPENYSYGGGYEDQVLIPDYGGHNSAHGYASHYASQRGISGMDPSMLQGAMSMVSLT